jgi:hypothetical protein
MKSRSAMTAMSLLSGFSIPTEELQGLETPMPAGYFSGNNVEQLLPSPDGPLW